MGSSCFHSFYPSLIEPETYWLLPCIQPKSSRFSSAIMALRCIYAACDSVTWPDTAAAGGGWRSEGSSVNGEHKRLHCWCCPDVMFLGHKEADTPSREQIKSSWSSGLVEIWGRHEQQLKHTWLEYIFYITKNSSTSFLFVTILLFSGINRPGTKRACCSIQKRISPL